MTAAVNAIRAAVPLPHRALPAVNRRVVAVGVLVTAVSVVPGGWALAADALSEAYLAVSVFVAGTLALLAYAERGLRTDLGAWLARHRRSQVPAAALLGAFPGCGGAIIAVTQFGRGYLSFGAVVAALVATMGDAMFLLLVAEPATAVGVLASSLVVGVVTGLLVDRVHGDAFMRARHRAPAPARARAAPLVVGLTDRLWTLLVVPGGVIGLLLALQFDVGTWLAGQVDVDLAYWLGIAGASLSVAMWSSTGESRGDCRCDAGRCDLAEPSPRQRVIDTTNFVTSWVVFAFVAYELLVATTGVDLGRAFAVWAPLVPAIAVLIGLIPGCGPQILVTSMYLSGSVPLSAQLGNAIANDGDALLPALAVAPRAAALATLYSAIPAVLVAYAWYAWAETGTQATVLGS
jgi:hypothetical protein